jgi:hypothetical protein
VKTIKWKFKGEIKGDENNESGSGRLIITLTWFEGAHCAELSAEVVLSAKAWSTPDQEYQ